ncbi:hypothetical protein B0H11DRAFT_1980636 [Mycena galericulata]|nr:hypothetical protein B0H11DRAFT_1980636 [Mycena galericulata]
MTPHNKDTSSPPPYGSSGPLNDKGGPDVGQRDRRYVYYRAYAPDGAIPSKTAWDPSNPLIGRVKATSVPPPLNVASLKRTLAHAESIPDPLGVRTVLWRLPSAQTSMDDEEKVSILGVGSGIALTPEDAVALVFIEELADGEKRDLPQIDSEVAQYLYYRLHTRTGEDQSVCGFDPEEPAVGRIDPALIAPPRNALAIKRCIAKIEGRPIYAFADLYEDVADDHPMADDACIAISTAGGVEFRGSSPLDALRVVQPERRPGLYNRPLKVVAVFYTARGPGYGYSRVFPGDILHTDYAPSEKPPSEYTVVNSKGIKGLIKAGDVDVKFLDE